ncbi:220_t:CDS:2, partial [Diversispora eburnea]
MNTINMVRNQKSAIREEMRNLLKQIPIDIIERESAIVSDKVLTSKEYLNNKICYVPRWNKDAMEMVRLLSYQDYISLPVNRWNIPEPSHDNNYEIGLAFDLQRNRLGHGKGYYDKYLAKCKNWAKENNRQLPKT